METSNKKLHPDNWNYTIKKHTTKNKLNENEGHTSKDQKKPRMKYIIGVVSFVFILIISLILQKVFIEEKVKVVCFKGKVNGMTNFIFLNNYESIYTGKGRSFILDIDTGKAYLENKCFYEDTIIFEDTLMFPDEGEPIVAATG